MTVRNDGLLAGRRLLVVEDEWLIAGQLRRTLERAGAVVLGPALSIEQALALLADEPPLDGALLDLNLRGELATPVARHLAERDVPFLLVTAYASDSEDEPLLRAAPRVGKPFAPAALVRAVARLWSAAG